MNRVETIEWLASMFDEPVANMSEATSRESIAGWDSMGTLTLMAEMDEKFDIQLDEKDIQSLRSIGDLLSFLEARGKLA